MLLPETASTNENCLNFTFWVEKTVCVVEDNEMVLELVVETLEDQGYQVLFALIWIQVP